MSLAYVEMYDGRPENAGAFLRYIVAQYLPLLRNWPGIRGVEIEQNAGNAGAGDTFLVIRCLFDRLDDLQAALASPSCARARAARSDAPAFAGRIRQQIMETLSPWLVQEGETRLSVRQGGARKRLMLFEPIRFRSVTARNRIMISPMCQYWAPAAVPDDWHVVHLGSRAVGGAGLVMTEATAVEPAGRISPFDVGLWNDEQEAAFGRIARFVTAQGAVAGIQLAHAGRKASHARPWEHRRPLTAEQGGWPVVGPSPIPFDQHDLMPHELAATEIERLVGDFQQATRRALRAGFQVVELHAAHGYLLHSFLTPLSNRRTDRYGGSFENRARFLLETVAAVREVWPEELPLFVRLSATDWTAGGWDIDDTVRVARMLAPLGVDLIDCSSGGATPDQTITAYPGYQVPLAAAVRSRAGLPTGAVGLLSDPFMVEAILANGEADLVALGRMALWDPYWPHHASVALGVEAALPIQYERCNIYARRAAAR